jgi:hypothetical protein
MTIEEQSNFDENNAHVEPHLPHIEKHLMSNDQEAMMRVSILK